MHAARVSGAAAALRRPSAGAWRRALSTGEQVVFPDERYGVDYGANWSAASLGVTVGSKSAFLNPGLKTVLAHASSVDRPSKAIKRGADGKQQLFGKVDRDAFEDIVKAAREALSSGPGALFVVDAAAGGAPKAAAAVRAVSDCAATARLLQNLLCGVPKHEPARFAPQVKLVHAAAPDAAAGAAYCAVLGSSVAARGKVDAASLAAALAAAAAAALEGRALVLKGRAALGKDGKLTLVLGGSDAAAKLLPGDVAVQRHVVWSKDGVSRLWNAAEGKPVGEGAVLEGDVAFSANGYKLPNLLPHPSLVILATGQPASALDADAIKKALPVASLLGATDKELALLDTLLKASQAKLEAK